MLSLNPIFILFLVRPFNAETANHDDIATQINRSILNIDVI